MAKKIAVFIENIFKICKKPYPFEFGGSWGLLVFHKYFLIRLIYELIICVNAV